MYMLSSISLCSFVSSISNQGDRLHKTNVLDRNVSASGLGFCVLAWWTFALYEKLNCWMSVPVKIKNKKGERKKEYIPCVSSVV